jgi:hypothetical protein
MAILAQFLAALANEIRQSKTLVDLETARQSTRFLKDDFLRLLPISRIDIDDVRLRFKMAVGELVVTPKDSPFIGALTDQLVAKIVEVTTKSRGAEKLSVDSLPGAITEAAVLTLVPELSELDPSRIASIRGVLAPRFAEYFVERFVKLTPGSTASVKRRVSNAAIEVFARVFDQRAQIYKEDFAAQLLKEFGRLDVVVEGQRLREFPPDVLVELELHLVPKTFHWSLKPEFIDQPEASPERKYTLMPGS